MGDLTFTVNLPEIIASLDRLHTKVDAIMSEDAAIQADVQAIVQAVASQQADIETIKGLLDQLRAADVAPETVAALDAAVASLAGATDSLHAVANPPA